MITGDASYIKQINRSIIIKQILKLGNISRADLSKATALTRATISAQVADLVEEQLVVEKQVPHHQVGRKPIMLSLNAGAGYALGIDLDYGQITFTISDLLGKPLSSASIKTETTDYRESVDLLAYHIKRYQEEYTEAPYGIVGIVIGVHGLVSAQKNIQYVPRLNWSNVQLKQDLEQALGVAIHIENNANLSAFAEQVFIHQDTDNLLCITLYSGIGMGMMINNKLLYGHNGFAGEIGHMILIPDGIPCECGNDGCWEKYASESSVFKRLAESNALFVPTYTNIHQGLMNGDEEIKAAMEQYIRYLSIGLNNIININNPDVIVLDSELLRLYPNATDKIRNQLHSRINHYQKLYISSIGRKSCVLGACALAIKNFLNIPIMNLPYDFSNESPLY